MSARSAARCRQEPSSSRDFGFVTFTGARARSTGTATHFTNVSCESFFTTSSLCGGPGGPGLSSLLTHSALRPARAAAAGYPGATTCMQLLGHALAPPVRRILDAPPRPLRRAGHPYVRDTPPRAVLRRLGLGRRTVVVGLLHHLRVWLEDGLARLQQQGGATRSHIPRSTRAHSLLRRLARPRAGAPSLWRRGR